MSDAFDSDVSGLRRAVYGLTAALLAAGLTVLPWLRWQSSTQIHSMLELPEAAKRLVTRHSVREQRPGLRILLAEDNLVNRTLAVRLLEKHGHAVEVATDGREALRKCKAGTFDLVLMDVQMPGVDGLEATAAIRDIEKTAGTHVPIVAMTAYALTGDRERCLAAGMDGYISKPFRVEELLQELEKLGKE